MSQLHNWPKILGMLVENANGTDLTGRPGEWDSALYQLIAETYRQPKAEGDRDILCVLLVLHEAIQGKTDLTELAAHCVEFSRANAPPGGKP